MSARATSYVGRLQERANREVERELRGAILRLCDIVTDITIERALADHSLAEREHLGRELGDVEGYVYALRFALAYGRKSGGALRPYQHKDKGRTCPGSFFPAVSPIEPAEVAITIKVDASTARLLAVLGSSPAMGRKGSVEGVLMHLAQSAAAGVRRPGAWERSWLEQAFGGWSDIDEMEAVAEFEAAQARRRAKQCATKGGA